VPLLDLEPFRDEHLEAAAALLAARHERHRISEPLLGAVDSRAAVEEAWRRDGASGAAAIRDGRLVGYVVGTVGERRFLGRSAWIDRAGHAAAEGEVLRDLYATAAEPWVAAGVGRHFANVPVGDEWLDPWYRLGFGQMHMAAIRPSGGNGVRPPAGVTIRRGGRDDVETAAIPVNRLIMELQAVSPSFLPVPLTEEEERADWAETFEDPGAAYFVAERSGRVVGHSLLYPPDPDLGNPPGTVYLASTATVPEVRGTGVGLALTDHVLAWAVEAGYRSVATNWRVTNLLASRFWPARGFRPTFVRLYRAIGES
jgi:ribosomal protein S18 acetylase RimI-like enzyme